MNSNHSYTRLIGLILLILLTFCSSIIAVNNAEDDLYFVISLYENQQYDLARQQISMFEQTYQNSAYAVDLIFLKANIAFAQARYNESDSLYTILLKNAIEPPMQSEAWINQAKIKFIARDYPATLRLLSQAEIVTDDDTGLFSIRLLSGQTHFKLQDYPAAQIELLAALTLKPFDPDACRELAELYKAMDDRTTGTAFFTSLIQDSHFSQDYAKHLNLWLDYLLENAAYPELDTLEMLLKPKVNAVAPSTRLRFIRKKYLQKDYETALEQLASVVGFSSVCRYITAQIYTEQGKYSQADSLFLTLVNPDSATSAEMSLYNNNLPLLAWLEHIKILYRNSPETALSYLDSFLQHNQENALYPDAMYIYGNLLYQSKLYNQAVNVLIKLKELPISPLAMQNAQICLGDIWFYARLYDQAGFAYNRYLNLFPDGKYRAYATYCIALIEFELKDYPQSAMMIKSLLSLPQSEPYRQKALFMLAEMDFFRADYPAALTAYQSLNNQYPGNQETLFRIAQTLFFSADYLTAADFVERITADSTNAYQILLLSGNIHFSLKQYAKAISAYDQALSYTTDEIDKTEVNSYKALALYRHGSFAEASRLYLQLSSEPESPEAYLLMAAKGAYHAKQYQHAISLFTQFISQYPTSPMCQNAGANIGNIWYNLGSFDKAVDAFIIVLQRYIPNTSFNNDEQQILTGVFANLQWCLKQAPRPAVLDSLNTMISSFQSEYIKFELQYLLLKIYYGSGEWDDVLTMADELRSQFPQRENNEIKRLVAGSLVKINRYVDADSLYQNIYHIEPTAIVLSEWAELDIQQGNLVTALDKYERALAMETTPERFIFLFTFLNDFLPDSLNVYWAKWQNKLSPVPDTAKLIWLKWNQQHALWADCLTIARGMDESTQQNIRAEVQSIHALALYHTGDYSSALVELLKTIYLYADYPEIVLTMQHTLVKTYLALNLPADALRYYNQISNQLDALDKDELSKLLNIPRDNDEKADSE